MRISDRAARLVAEILAVPPKQIGQRQISIAEKELRAVAEEERKKFLEALHKEIDAKLGHLPETARQEIKNVIDGPHTLATLGERLISEDEVPKEKPRP